MVCPKYLFLIFPFLLVEQFASGLSSCYTEYAAWCFAILDHSVTGGTEAFLRAAFESPSVGCFVL